MNSSISTFEAAKHLAVAAAVALTCFAVSVAVGQSWFSIAIQNSSRAMNVRLLPELYRSPFIETFISQKLPIADAPLIVLMGDSQSWGFYESEKDVFSSLLQRMLPRCKVLNLSVVDGRQVDQEEILRLISAKDLRPRLVITSMNLAHLADPDVHRLVRSRWPHWSWFLSPINVSRLWKLVPAKVSSAKDRSFRRIPIPNRFVDSEAAMRIVSEQVSQTLALAQTTAENVLFYMPPHAVEDFAGHQYDRKLYNRQVGHMLKTCMAARAQCLDLSDRVTLDGFRDIVHLNRRGHELMAGLLLPAVRSVAPECVPD